MNEKKLNLKSLSVKSFITDSEKKQLKGGDDCRKSLLWTALGCTMLESCDPKTGDTIEIG